MKAKSREAIERRCGHAPASDDMVSHRLLFLLKNQDPYGVGYPTQAAVEVLDALAAFTAPLERVAGRSTGPRAILPAQKFTEGRQVVSIPVLVIVDQATLPATVASKLLEEPRRQPPVQGLRTTPSTPYPHSIQAITRQSKTYLTHETLCAIVASKRV